MSFELCLSCLSNNIHFLKYSVESKVSQAESKVEGLDSILMKSNKIWTLSGIHLIKMKQDNKIAMSTNEITLKALIRVSQDFLPSHFN